VAAAACSSVAAGAGVGSASRPGASRKDTAAKKAATPASAAAAEPVGLLDTRFWISNVRGSSHEPDPDAGRFAYEAVNAFDDVAETLWMEGVDGPGLGESVQVTFNRPVRITGIGLSPGPADYNRPTALLVSFSDGPPVRASVGDALGPRRADLPPTTTRMVRVAVDEVRIGEKHDRTAVAELLLYGAPLPYAEPAPDIMSRLKDRIDSGAYHTVGGGLEEWLAEARLKRIEVAWYIATRGVDAFAVGTEAPFAPVAELLYDLGDDGQRVLVHDAERLLREPGLGAAAWVMKVDAFWYHSALLNECYRGILDVGPKGAPHAGDAVGAAWHGCAGLLRNGDVRGLTAFALRLIDGGGAAALAARAGLPSATKLPALRLMRDSIRGRAILTPFKKAFTSLRVLAKRKGDAALVNDLAAAATLRPAGS
jgi:hypothetical protein